MRMKRRLMLVNNHISLMRINQWYKNLVVFIPLVFSGRLFDFSSFLAAVLAFFSLCLLSSGNFTINDVVELKEDRLHAEKKWRPLVSRKVTSLQAFAFALVLYAFGFLIALQVGTLFFLISY